MLRVLTSFRSESGRFCASAGKKEACAWYQLRERGAGDGPGVGGREGGGARGTGAGRYLADSGTMEVRCGHRPRAGLRVPPSRGGPDVSVDEITTKNTGKIEQCLSRYRY